MRVCSLKYYTFSFDIYTMRLVFPGWLSWKLKPLLPSSPACLDSSRLLVQWGKAKVAVRSWLKRARSVNIVRKRSNKLKQNNQTKNRKPRQNSPLALSTLSFYWNWVTNQLCSKPPGNWAARAVSVVRVRSAPRKRPQERLGTKAAPRDAADGWAGTCRHRRLSVSRWDWSRSAEVSPAPSNPFPARAKRRGRAPAAAGACSRSSRGACGRQTQTSATLWASLSQGWGGPTLRTTRRPGSAEGRPGPPRDTRDASSCLDPGKPRGSSVGRGGGATWEAPGARLLPGARLPAAGAQLAGVSRELGLRPQKPPNLLPWALGKPGRLPVLAPPWRAGGWFGLVSRPGVFCEFWGAFSVLGAQQRALGVSAVFLCGFH